MTNEAVEILLQLLFVTLASCFTYFVGFFLIPIVPIGRWGGKSVFARPYFIMVLGLTVIVLLFSLITTTGKSIHFLLLPILACLYFLPREERPNNGLKQILWYPMFWLIAVSVLFVLLFHLLPESVYKQMDSLHYLYLSKSLGDFGQENVFASLISLGKPFVGVEPYHYFEFWWNAFLLKLFGGFLPGIMMLRFVSFAVISSISLFGLFALAEKIAGRPLNFLQKFFCIAFIFYWPNIFTLFDTLRPVFTYSFENNFIERPNFRTCYLFMPGLLMALKGEINIRQILFWAVGLMVASLTFFCTIIPPLLLLCLFFFFNKSNVSKKSAFILFVAVIAAAFFYLLFYHFFRVEIKSLTENITINNLFKYVTRYWKIISLNSVTSVFNCVFIPCICFLFLHKKYGIKLKVFFELQYIAIFLCGAIVWGVIMARFFNFVEDAYQFAFTSYIASAFVVFVLLFGSVGRFNLSKKIFAFGGCVIIIYYMILRFSYEGGNYTEVFSNKGFRDYGDKTLSTKYTNNLLSSFSLRSKVNGAFWADSLYYDSVRFYSSRNPNVYALASSYFLAGKLNSNYELCLSDSSSIMYGIDTAQKVSYNYLKFAIFRSAFYQFLQTSDISTKRLALIKKYKLQYLLLTKNADTTIIKSLPISKYFQDENTGERFYLIDINKL